MLIRINVFDFKLFKFYRIMTQIMNFKRMEVTGATKDEALAKAPFDIMGDAIQAY